MGCEEAGRHGPLIHGMIDQGVQKGNHYGPVSVGVPDDEARDECMQYGKVNRPRKRALKQLLGFCLTIILIDTSNIGPGFPR
jgi:hypothetical protein